MSEQVISIKNSHFWTSTVTLKALSLFLALFALPVAAAEYAIDTSHTYASFEQEKLIAVEGTLVMLGEAKPMRLEVTRFKCGFNLALRKRGCGADAQGVLRRSDFGLQNGLPFIGDDVRLRIQVEAYLP